MSRQTNPTEVQTPRRRGAWRRCALRDHGDEVIVIWHGSGTGRASGAPVEWNETHRYTLRDGKVTEVREYRDLAAALEAL